MSELINNNNKIVITVIEVWIKVDLNRLNLLYMKSMYVDKRYIFPFFKIVFGINQNVNKIG